ncbi:Uncharacterised protein [Mycobacteroides abscessus subsp. abscessus]|nr:Uncharacterised protein [Mycobacteroides abscessus subsp. abscessus]
MQDVLVLVVDGLLVPHRNGDGTPGYPPGTLVELAHRFERLRLGTQGQPGTPVELDRTQTAIDTVDLVGDAVCLLLGELVQPQHGSGRLLGDQPQHPFVGSGQVAFIDPAAERDIVVDLLVEVLTVVGDRVGEVPVVRVENPVQLVT